jgi:para-nitrobenzyl esterase
MHGGTQVIDTTHGPVRGEHKRGAWRFKGIPYAAPPVDELRFRPPEPALPWTDVLDAVGRFPIAPQPLGGMEAVAGGRGSAEQSEARCLTLNVWTLAPDDARRPVMFWIHGGGFVTGAGTIPWYDGANLAARDVVVVTCNYRLGALGFLHLADIGGEDVQGSGNVGLLDQIAALRWVRDNVAAFGGDPRNVTIFGESAGGMSVGTLLGTPAAHGLFHKAVPQSGAASNVHGSDRATDVAERVMERLGVEDVDGLRQVPAERLIDVQSVGDEFGRGGGLPFQPVIDGIVLEHQPIELVRRGAAAGIPLLAGHNAHEMRLFTLLDPRLRDTDRARNLALLERYSPGRGAELLESYESAVGEDPVAVLESAMTDRVFRLPAIELLEAQAPHADVYGYEFRFESTAFGGVLGAAHAVEIPFVFDNLDSPGAAFFTGEPTEAMRSLSAAMADAWVSFARGGAPSSPRLPDWPSYDPAHRPTMILGLDQAVEQDPGGELRRAWAGPGRLGSR